MNAVNEYNSKALYLFRSLSIVFILYTIHRIIFIALHHHALQLDSPKEVVELLIGGMRFDLSAILITNGLIIIFYLIPIYTYFQKFIDKVLRYIFIAVNGICLFLSTVDLVYFPYIQKRMQADAFYFLTGKKGTDFYQLLPTFIIQFFPFWLITGIIIYMINKKWQLPSIPFDYVSPKQTTIRTLIYLTVIIVSLLGIRGGFQLKPLKIIHASQMTSVENIPAIINTPFSIIKSKSGNTLQKYIFNPISNETIQQATISDFSNRQAFKRQNVIIIIIESFSKTNLGLINNKVKTPFLDSLARKSLFFPNAYANAKESIQGIPAILASIPHWQEEPFMYTSYGTNGISSFANILKSENYSSAFFHGGMNGTMAFDLFCSHAGFEKYFGRKEYNNEKDFDGLWGIWDHSFLAFTSEEISALDTPFVAAVFTMNPHHPFRIPENFKHQFINQNPLYASMSYIDYSLEVFFNKIKENPWFDNTLFIITADHTAPKDNKPEKKNKGISSTIADYQIPVIFFHPGLLKPEIDSSIINQIDIMPTAMSILNFPHPFFSFGHDALDKEQIHHSISYKNEIFQYIDSTHCLYFNGDKVIKWFPLTQNSITYSNTNNKSQLAPKYAEDLLKKDIQIHNHCMIHNLMSAERMK